MHRVKVCPMTTLLCVRTKEGSLFISAGTNCKHQFGWYVSVSVSKSAKGFRVCVKCSIQENAVCVCLRFTSPRLCDLNSMQALVDDE